MNRLTEFWFEFRGKRSDELGVELTRLPQRGIPARNLTRVKVAGRSGRVRISDGSYDDVSVKQEFVALDESKLPEIHEWLSGSGSLRFSDEPDYVYDAVIEQSTLRQQVLPRFTAQKGTVAFLCDPRKHLYTPAEDIVIDMDNPGGNPSFIVNPGTAVCDPKVVITGSGTFSLTIGTQTMFFRGVESGVMVDSALGDALTADGTALANNWISGSDLFHIQPGSNPWEVISGGMADDGTTETGEVHRIVITPRWRYL